MVLQLRAIATFILCGISVYSFGQDANQAVDIVHPDSIPPSPVLSPQQALSDFVLEDGFAVELVASEPDVVDPVALVFDEFGAIWVVEMRGYMPDPTGAGEDEPVGRIVVLEDINGDGTFEQRSVFMDGLVMPRAIALYQGGVLVAAPPNLLFVENDNYQAGNVTVVDPSYAVGGNPEHQPNGLLVARDNWIYSAKSDVRYRLLDGSWKSEKTEYRGQWGITQDDVGRLFYNNNSQMLLGDEFRPNVFPMNPHHKLPRMYPYGASRASNAVYPARVNPGVNRAYRPNILGSDGKLIEVTSAAGPVVYRGSQFPDTHYGNVFVQEPAANLIKRIVLSESNGAIGGEAPYTEREFLTSTDERFRPVNGYTAPDGTMYIVDMYRGIIQHETYLTDYLKRQIEMRGLETPLGLGRIYRIRSADSPITKAPRPGNVTNSELVDLLSHPNGWHRDTAQRLLIERNAEDVQTELAQLIATNANWIASTHALWTLEGLGFLTLNDIVAAASHQDNRITAIAVELSRLFSATQDVNALNMLADIGTSSDAEIATVVASISPSFRSLQSEQVDAMLIDLARRHDDSQRVIDAIVGGLEDREAEFLRTLRDIEQQPQALKIAVERASEFALVQEASSVRYVLSDEQMSRGRAVYENVCSACHGADGNGLQSLGPTLRRSQWVLQDEKRLIRLVLDGVQGPIQVDGKIYTRAETAGFMPGLRDIIPKDADLAAVLTFIRNSWDNRAPAIPEPIVTHLRGEEQRRLAAYTAEELEASENDWTILFDGATLNGWIQVNGSAPYRIEDQAIVGTTVRGSPNSFLATERSYSDFILELEFKVDPSMNSGVQVRSNVDASYNDGRVFGYQVEIDPSQRAWTGGLYEEGRRGWLFPLRGNPAAQQAFRQNEWNHLRIEFRGSHLRTWVNGTLATDMVDSLTPEGFIALQVHSIPSSDEPGKEVRWRNIRIKELE